jgi:RecA-family ATPase
MNDEDSSLPTNEPLTGSDLEDHFGEDLKAGEQARRHQERAARRDLSHVFRSVGRWEWLDCDPPPARPLVKLPSGAPWLPRGKVGMLAAPGGVGKSQALIQLALCVACGPDSERKWLGHFDIPPEARGPVVLALGEEGQRDCHRRIRHVVDGLGYTDDECEAVRRNLYTLPLAGRPSALLDDPGRLVRSLRDTYPQGPPQHELKRASIGHTEQVATWRKLLEAPPGGDEGREWKTIILDPASRFIGPEAEQDNAVATRFVEILEDWALTAFGDQDVGPSVLFSHHVKKSSTDSPKALLHDQGAARGSSGLTDGVRWQANMAVHEFKEHGETSDVVGLNVVKSNNGPPGDKTFLKRTKHGVLAYDTYGAQKFYDNGDEDTDDRFAGNDNENRYAGKDL